MKEKYATDSSQNVSLLSKIRKDFSFTYGFLLICCIE
jgi:hypothetical protein